MRVVEAINQGLHSLMEASPDLIVLGEDVVDPYGGAFKVTAGLSTRYPDRVWSMPILNMLYLLTISGASSVYSPCPAHM